MSKLSYFLFSNETAERPNLLYFLIFNNKYIEMFFKWLNGVLKYIKFYYKIYQNYGLSYFQKRKKEKYVRYSLFLHIKIA